MWFDALLIKCADRFLVNVCEGANVLAVWVCWFGFVRGFSAISSWLLCVRPRSVDEVVGCNRAGHRRGVTAWLWDDPRRGKARLVLDLSFVAGWIIVCAALFAMFALVLSMAILIYAVVNLGAVRIIC